MAFAPKQLRAWLILSSPQLRHLLLLSLVPPKMVTQLLPGCIYSPPTGTNFSLLSCLPHGFHCLTSPRTFCSCCFVALGTWALLIHGLSSFTCRSPPLLLLFHCFVAHGSSHQVAHSSYSVITSAASWILYMYPSLLLLHGFYIINLSCGSCYITATIALRLLHPFGPQCLAA